MEGTEALTIELKSLKRKYSTVLNENWALLDQLEKYRETIKRLTREKSFLLEKLATIEYDDEFEVSEGDESDEEPAAKRRRTNSGTPSRSRRSRNDGPSQMCLAKRRDGSQCKSKAIAGKQFCWHHAPLDPNSKVEICEYRNKKKNSKRCNIPISKESAEKNIMLCNYHRRKMQDQATEDNANQLTNTEAQIYMQGAIPGITGPEPTPSLPRTTGNSEEADSD